MLDLPFEFVSRMKTILGEDFANFLSSLDSPLEKAIYVNTSKITVEDFSRIVDFPIEKIDYESAGFYVDNEKKGRHVLHHAGAFYIQEPNAMFTVNAHKFKGDEFVLDMCSAPGGKSIQIANRIPNGILVSNEYNPARSKVLFSNIERMGLKNVIITNDTPDNIANAYANTFDVVLVDAPCSGEGMFRRGEAIIDEWNVGINAKCKARQLDILFNADIALRQGGTLIYSTCTYSLEENEEVIRDFLRAHEYELVDIKANTARGVIIDDEYEYSKCVRLYPHLSRGEGQFVAVMKKIGPNSETGSPCVKLNNSAIANKFIKDNFDLSINVREINGKIYYVNNESLIRKGVKYVTSGVLLGEIVKDRFEPSHNLFTAFGADCKRKIDINYNSDMAHKYLRGETLDVDVQDGYGALLINGCSVGGYKMSGGKFKNHYPKGLRNMK